MLTILLFTGMATAQNGADSEQEIKTLLENRDKEIKELLGPEGTEYSEEQRAQLKEIINGIIDFRKMAEETLEETYDTISKEKQEEFVQLFSTIIRDNSLNKLDIYRAQVRYKTIEVKDSSAYVETLAQLDDVRTPVYYDMVHKDNEWFITDIIIDDVSTIGSYNRQFQRIIKRKGFESLMESLRKRAAKA
ncbi:MAG: ABC transporter substrate-binding protein [Balneolaceae bacterium]|nr:ABC transporter substrate-binding protein [Balneolaceae bacterium]